MAGGKVTVDVSDVKRAFARIEPVFRKEIAVAMGEGGEDVVRFARTFAPTHLGNLRAFIAYSVDEKTSRGKVGLRAGTIQPAHPTRNSASKYPSVYGRFIHEGRKVKKAHGGSYRLQGKPFMLQAAIAARGPVQQHYNAALVRSMKVLHGEYLASGGST